MLLGAKQMVSSDLLLSAWKLDKNWCYRFYCLLASISVSISVSVLSRLLPFRFVSLCGHRMVQTPVRWHCNAYSLFRSCRVDRISYSDAVQIVWLMAKLNDLLCRVWMQSNSGWTQVRETSLKQLQIVCIFIMYFYIVYLYINYIYLLFITLSFSSSLCTE